ncbi:MAG: TerB family tellurite resistance protein [Hyphomonadaceae bacterium]|nr:TerB family tellurite resistance protein [Hyphomonadaceae bacterium]
MHIVGLIIGIITAIAIWQWRIQRAAEAARELEGVVKTAANLPRRFAFKRKSGRRGLSLVDDPREAAALLMVEIARAGGDISAQSRETIEEIIRAEFQVGDEDAQALIAYAQWVLRDAPVADAVVRRMSKFLVETDTIGPKEIVDLDGMLVAVSEADGLPNAEQLGLLQTFRNVAGVQT